jgi:predicted patatin/cPLA2 family phospholipase
VGYIKKNIKLGDYFSTYGLINSRFLENIVKFFLKYKGYDKNVTFRQLYKKTNKTLTCVITNITTNRTIYANYRNTPDLQVYKAIGISMLIPFIFKCNTINKEYYIDGCYGCNFPLELFNIKDTLGIYLRTNKDDEVNIYKKEGNEILFIKYINSIMRTMLVKSEDMELKYYLLKKYKICVLSNDTLAIEFNISNENKKKLIMDGYEQIKEWYRSNSNYI